MGKSILNSVSPLIPYRPFIPKDGRQQKPKILIVIAALMVLAAGAAFAQTIAVPSLADRSTIIVRGKVLKINGQSFKILGVMAAKGGTSWQSPDDQVWVPLFTAM